MFRSWAKPLLIVLTLAAAAALAQQTVIRVDVKLVHVTATVKNKNGELVGTLQKNEFELYDRGVRQEISVFQRKTELPLSVSLLIDISGSTGKDLKYETDSASRFLKALLAEGNPEDAVELFAFNYDITRLRYWTRNYASLERSLKGLHPEGSTSVHDAVWYAARDLDPREGRKAIVIIIDGADTTSSRTVHQALEAAQLSDAVIYPIVVMPITNDAGRSTGGEHALEFLAQGTGGRTFYPSVGAELDRALTDIVNELRTQYVLGFYPRNVPLSKDRFHKLEVRVTVPGLRVSARNGYYGDSEGDSARTGSR
ncbi:MAG TPA: VWA domain-containing protein [Bryobacteraceae bacterium]